MIVLAYHRFPPAAVGTPPPPTRATPQPGAMSDRDTMLIQADSLADEGILLSATPSYLVVEFRHLRKLYSLHTGIPHEETT